MPVRPSCCSLCDRAPWSKGAASWDSPCGLALWEQGSGLLLPAGRKERTWFWETGALGQKEQSVISTSGCIVLFLNVISTCVPFSIMGVLSNKCGFQLQYQMIFSVWLLAFSPQMCEHLRRYNIIPVLSDILQESVKEKVTRIILAAFRVSVLWGVFPVGECVLWGVCVFCICGVLVCVVYVCSVGCVYVGCVLWDVCVVFCSVWCVCGVRGVCSVGCVCFLWGVCVGCV